MYDVFPSLSVPKYTISDYVREMYESGCNVKEICRRTRLRQETVTQWLKAKDNTNSWTSVSGWTNVGGEI